MTLWNFSEPIFESDRLNDKLRVAPWEGHRLFAYDYIRFVKPKRIVELGTHFGCSFFAFCQSVKDFNLNSKLIAVDTWTGDEQAGFYGNEVIDKVTETVNVYFNHLDIDLKRKTFDEALAEVEDNSVELLHIDGLHTYEAVKHDFETWLPKLKEQGVVFFHDVFSLLGYGSDIFWEEIKVNYNYIEFKHSWGLGVLFPKGDHVYKFLLEGNISDKIEIYTYRAKYEFEKLKTNDLSNMVEEKDKVIDQLENMVADRDIAIKSNEALIQDKDTIIARMDLLIKDKENAIAAIEYLVDEKDMAISSMTKMIDERDSLCQNYESEIEKLKTLARENNNEFEQLSSLNIRNTARIEQLNTSNIENANMIQQLKKQISDLEDELNYYRSKKIIFNLKKRKVE
ncbi:class I SAM-dependent methyltransferase [Paenibacillus sp. SGZ-1009]|uniref:class I SAM-dependent methyltransferase n=1 Tax=Paenibacillus campi TaxID=3106031 RepID=UPI002AFE9F72|nr:class I SAM-dependent methyltransferase [Paenibacillus sp. SGZ-1009]